jgi:RNA processing factor Prp31
MLATLSMRDDSGAAIEHKRLANTPYHTMRIVRSEQQQQLLQVDTMIVQAIGLLDELDKEINTYAMRVREWYGWHFPEMAKVILLSMVLSLYCVIAGLGLLLITLAVSDTIADRC